MMTGLLMSSYIILKKVNGYLQVKLEKLMLAFKLERE